jgi:nucleoside-diphosphate-sugar epimerase
MTGAILVTGADGYVGRLVTGRLLEETAAALVLAVRAGGPEELRCKRDRLGVDPGSARVRVVPADLRSPEPFQDVEPASISRIVHTAAVTRFNIERPVAEAVNVEGTRKVVDFARRCSNLRLLLALSSVYSAGRLVGPLDEVPHDEPGFVNYYEWSKWAAERTLLDAAGDVPVAIARLGTLIADDDSGAVVQHNAFHMTFRLLYYGLLSVIPGDADTPLYLLTGALAAAATVHLLLHDDSAGIYHVCPERAEVPTIGRLLDEVLDVFDESPDYRARRLLRPLLCNQAAFDGLVAAASTIGDGPLRQAVTAVSPFAEQLFLAKEVHNPRLRHAFPAYEAPDPGALTRATITSLVATKWGRAPRRP